MEPLKQDNPEWGPLQRALFRFLFSYLVLYNTLLGHGFHWIREQPFDP